MPFLRLNWSFSAFPIKAVCPGDRDYQESSLRPILHSLYSHAKVRGHVIDDGRIDHMHLNNHGCSADPSTIDLLDIFDPAHRVVEEASCQLDQATTFHQLVEVLMVAFIEMVVEADTVFGLTTDLVGKVDQLVTV